VTERNVESALARAGRQIDVGPRSRVYVLFPEERFLDPDTMHAPPNLNNTSVVVKLLYGRVSFLLSGDAELEAEEAMVRRYGSFLRSSVLKVGHHGSLTSSVPAYLSDSHPSFAVISVGQHNTFHHPSPVVLGRLSGLGATVARTDMEGAVIFESDGLNVRRIHWR
jgi:competence protein ComEC